MVSVGLLTALPKTRRGQGVLGSGRIPDPSDADSGESISP